MRLAVAVMLSALLVAGCEEQVDTTLLFDRGGSVAAHPLPSNHVAVDVGGVELLAGFSASQTEEMFFLTQLAIEGATGWSASPRIRVAFTAPGFDADIKVDPATVPEALRLYDVGRDAAEARALAEHEVNFFTGSVLVRPAQPLVPGTYAVAVRAGVMKTRGGGSVLVDAGYAAIQASGDPATDEAFAKVVAADPDIGGRADTIAFTVFEVQDHVTAMAAVEEAISGKIAAYAPGADADVTIGVTAWNALERQLAVDGALVAKGEEMVAARFAEVAGEGVPVAGVGAVAEGWVSTPNFLSDLVPADDAALFHAGTIRGKASNLPVSLSNPPALSASLPFRPIPYLAFFPAQWPQEADGSLAPLPVVVALHGFSRSKEDWYGIASAVCSSGRALVAIDHYQHGARQEMTAYPEGSFGGKVDPYVEALAPGAGFPDPFLNPTFLGRTRDKWRQSVADQLSLVQLLAAGDGTDGRIDFDGDGRADNFGSISLVGQSLGSMLGTIATAVSPLIDRAVLSVPGGGLAGIAANSASLGPNITLLIAATANAPDFGLLHTSERNFTKDIPEREVFNLVAASILGPADPISYARHLLAGDLREGAAPRVLMHFVAGDPVVPNAANARLARGVAAGAADPASFPHVVTADNPELFAMGLETATDLTGSGVTQWVGTHEMIFDFVDPEVTAAAQAQAIEFLDAP